MELDVIKQWYWLLLLLAMMLLLCLDPIANNFLQLTSANLVLWKFFFCHEQKKSMLNTDRN